MGNLFLRVVRFDEASARRVALPSLLWLMQKGDHSSNISTFSSKVYCFNHQEPQWSECQQEA